MILPVFGIVEIYWHLPVLVVVISLVYSATRYEDWGQILVEAWRWGFRLVGFLVGVSIVLYAVATMPSWAVALVTLGVIVILYAASTLIN